MDVRLGPKAEGMSALPPKADMCGAVAHVRLVPEADISVGTTLRAPNPRPARSLRHSQLARAELFSRSDYFSTVRIPAGPPGTLIWPVTFRDLPSKLSTSSALSSMDCASSVLPSLLQTTP